MAYFLSIYKYFRKSYAHFLFDHDMNWNCHFVWFITTIMALIIAILYTNIYLMMTLSCRSYLKPYDEDINQRFISVPEHARCYHHVGLHNWLPYANCDNYQYIFISAKVIDCSVLISLLVTFLLIGRKWYQFIVWHCPNGVHPIIMTIVRELNKNKNTIAPSYIFKI